MGINFTDIATSAPVIAATFNDPLDELDAAIKKNNYAATAAPGVGDDSADGYTVGSRWIDTTNDKVYVAVDVTVGAARWIQLGNDTLVLPASGMGAVSGPPTAGTLGPGATTSAYTWLCSDAATQIAGAAAIYLGSKSGTQVTFELYYAMESATSGNVRLGYSLEIVAVGGGMAASGSLIGATEAVPGVAKNLAMFSITLSKTYAPGNLVRLTAGRVGGDAADTASGNMHLIAVVVRFL